MVSSFIVEICGMEGVNAPVITTDIKNINSFYFEVYKFAIKIGFPYQFKNGGNEMKSLIPRIQILLFLITELQSSKIIGPIEPEQQQIIEQNVKLSESEKLISKYIGNTCNVLGVECPKNAFDATHNIHQYLKTILSKMKGGKYFLTAPLLDVQKFNETQLKILELINVSFSNDFRLRKTMLRKRMEVTIESMLESERAKEQLQSMQKGLQKKISWFG